MPKPFGLDLVKLAGVTAPQPYMRPVVAEKFVSLRNKVANGAGFDFLGTCGDIYRDAGFVSKKDGVATRSFHKTGRVFDYNQTSDRLVIVSELRGGKQYFRTFLKCTKQDGSLGAKLKIRDMRGYNVDAYLFDFTAAAEGIGFERIPAWNGWLKNYNRREFWHYQFDEGLTWDAAMLQLKSKSRPHADRVIGLNDRGDDVREIQAKLIAKKLLPAKELDGVYGAKTKAAVEAFQKANGLDIDGLVGPLTRAKLFS